MAGVVGAPNTGSTLGLNNGVNKTSVSLSTNILILVNGVAVGAVKSLSIQESRDIEFIKEIGTDGNIDSAPKSSTRISGSCERVRFDRLRITEAFGRGFIHVQSQAYPFDIVIMDKQKRDQASQISTVIKNVWIKSIDTNYQSDQWIISDKMNWEAETIFSVLNNGNRPVAVGGERGIQHMGTGPNGVGLIDIEQKADTGFGGRRGSLDASGLIDIGDAGNLF